MGGTPVDPAPASFDPQTEARPGLILLVDDQKCMLCGAPKVYAEPTLGLSERSGGLQATSCCMNAPCPAALQAAPLLSALRRVLKSMRD